MAQAADCIHCHRCRNSCGFLTKYNMDVTQVREQPELSYHCFLCGKCTEVCPIDIDGRQEVLSVRQELGKDENKLKPYRMIRFEKENYIFRNDRHMKKKSVFFPGCNFLGFYPKTCRRVYEILEEALECGILYDCCGKPISEIGVPGAEEAMIREFQERLDKAQVEELITTCPNCYAYLKPRLKISVVSVYEKLAEILESEAEEQWYIEKSVDEGQYINEDQHAGEGQYTDKGHRVNDEQSVVENRSLDRRQSIAEERNTDRRKHLHGRIFLPCPDRREKVLLKQIQPFFAEPLEELVIDDVQCCGLGGCVGRRESDIIAGFGERIREAAGEGELYTYCASCSGRLSTQDKEAVHLLTLILETYERPDTARGWVNRAIHKFR